MNTHFVKTVLVTILSFCAVLGHAQTDKEAREALNRERAKNMKSQTGEAVKSAGIQQSLEVSPMVKKKTQSEAGVYNAQSLPPDFPRFIHTGDKETDIKNYEARTAKWAADNPERYSALFPAQKNYTVEEIEDLRSKRKPQQIIKK